VRATSEQANLQAVGGRRNNAGSAADGAGNSGQHMLRAVLEQSNHAGFAAFLEHGKAALAEVSRRDLGGWHLPKTEFGVRL
jgi:hypothetical protein